MIFNPILFRSININFQLMNMDGPVGVMRAPLMVGNEEQDDLDESDVSTIFNVSYQHVDDGRAALPLNGSFLYQLMFTRRFYSRAEDRSTG